MAAASAGGSRSYTFKVVLLGEGRVGKTSMVLRYVENKFNDKHVETLKASFLNQKLNIDGKRITLSLWDTAGQEKYHALGPIYYRDSNGAVVVYDITDEDSFQKAKNWVKELRQMLGNEICLCVVGNKIDLQRERKVPAEEADAYAASVGAKHFVTSAKLNKGIEDLFLDLSLRMMAAAQESVQQKTSNMDRASSQRNNIIVTDDETLQKKSGCCGSG